MDGDAMSEKKPYSKPSLTKWGTVADLTTTAKLGVLGDGLLGGGSSGSVH
jgi:hypothetical protein